MWGNIVSFVKESGEAREEEVSKKVFKRLYDRKDESTFKINEISVHGKK